MSFSYSNSPDGFSSNIVATTSHEEKLQDITLQHFSRIANEDVEMQPPVEHQTTFLILDTNILLHDFDVLVQFVADIEQSNAPIVIVVPGAVIKELDGHKHNPELKWFASTSSTWLLKKVKEHNKVRGQASGETLRKSGNWRIKSSDETEPERLNDYLILDCCIFYQKSFGPRTVLWSGDKLLCVDAEAEGIETIKNSPDARKKWSSRFLVQSLFGSLPTSALDAFKGEHVHFNRKTIIVEDVNQTAPVDPDAMDVDNTPNHGLVMTRLDVRDDLFRQTRRHFTMLLQDLVETVGGNEIRRRASEDAPSRYAPKWQLNLHNRVGADINTWSASECLEYLDAQKPIPITSPRLETFLRAPYSGSGARRGQDWSRADWQMATRSLKKIGVDWKDEVFVESSQTLEALLASVFEQSIEL